MLKSSSGESPNNSRISSSSRSINNAAHKTHLESNRKNGLETGHPAKQLTSDGGASKSLDKKDKNMLSVENEQHFREIVYQTVQIGHKWGTIDYRDSKYHGRMLITKTQISGAQNKISRSTDRQNQLGLDYARDGPGILILDCHLWVLARWKKNKLISTYPISVITADLGILELHLNSNLGQDLVSIQDVQKQIKQFSYTGRLYSNDSFSSNSVYKKEEKFKRYTIMADKVSLPSQQSKDSDKKSVTNSQDNYQSKKNNYSYKWLVDLTTENNALKNDSLYFLRSSHDSSSHEIQIQEIKQLKEEQLDSQIQKKNASNNRNNIENEKNDKRVGGYQYFINLIKQTLLDDKDPCKQYGFRVVENKYSTVNTTQITRPSSPAPPASQRSVGVQATICSSTEDNESIYIKILSHSVETSSNLSFTIEQLSILQKQSPNNLSSSSAGSIGQICLPSTQSKYIRKYMYSIKSHWHSLSENENSLSSILPQLQIEEFLEPSLHSDGRYRYTYHYNRQSEQKQKPKTKSLKTYIQSGNKQFNLASKQKRNLHLRSPVLVQNTSKKLSQSLHLIMCWVTEIYFQVKLTLIEQSRKAMGGTLSGVTSVPIRRRSNTTKTLVQPSLKESHVEEASPKQLKQQLQRILEPMTKSGVKVPSLELSKLKNSDKNGYEKNIQNYEKSDNSHINRNSPLNRNYQRNENSINSRNNEKIVTPMNFGIGKNVATQRSDIEGVRFRNSRSKSKTKNKNQGFLFNNEIKQNSSTYKEKQEREVREQGSASTSVRKIQDQRRRITASNPGVENNDKKKYKFSVYQNKNSKRNNQESDADIDNQEQNDVVATNYSSPDSKNLQTHPTSIKNLSSQSPNEKKQRKYSECPSSIKSPSQCASHSPSHPQTPLSSKKRMFEKVQQNLSLRSQANVTQCEDQLLMLTQQYSQITKELLTEAKKNKIPLSLLKGKSPTQKSDTDQEFVISRRNTVSYQNNNNNNNNLNSSHGKNGHFCQRSCDEEHWKQEYQQFKGVHGNNNVVNVRKRTQSIYEDYVHKYK